MFLLTALVLGAATLAGVSAHGGVLSYSNAGNWYWGWHPYNTPVGQTSIQRPWAVYDPIQGATNPNISCNDDGTAGALQLTATWAAGSQVTGYWNPWPHNTGPVIVYLANCNGDCTSQNSAKLKWFKIDQAGLLSGTVFNGTWAAGKMIAGNSSWTTTIPSTVPSGNYMIRFETIALHSLPAQFYPECAQVTITGGGTLQPTANELVSLPGAYSDNDPGINIDIYGQAAQTQTTYVIPGPPLYGSSGSGTGSGGGGSTGSGTTTPPPTTTHGPTTTSAPTTSSTGTSGGSGPTSPHYGQCGGQGWTGPTICAAPYSCIASSPYYSQCL